MNIEKKKLNVSNCLKYYNYTFHRNYTVSDVADCVGCSRETLQRLTTFSSYALVSVVIDIIYRLYLDDFTVYYCSLENSEVREFIYDYMLVE